MKTVTVVITSGNERADEARRTAARWAAKGLLQESIWLTADDAVIPDSGPPTVWARTVSSMGEGEAQDLFTLIARRRIDLLRIIVLQLLPYGEAPDPKLLSVGVRVADLVKEVLPRDVTVLNGVGTPLLRANLLVPETGARDISQEFLAAGWEVNVIASPEDRPDLDHASVFVRADVNYRAHAVAALACVGGLWPGVPSGAFDEVEVDSTSSEIDVVVFRPSVRLLLDDERPRRIADAAIALVQDPSGNGASAFVPWGAAAQTPDEAAATAHAELITRGDWARDELRPLDGAPRFAGFGEAFGDLVRFQGRLLLAASRLIRSTATKWVEGTATVATAGSDGMYVVRVDPRSPDQLMLLAKERLDAASSEARTKLLEREATKSQPPLANTWTELRQLCFGLADGSELPTGFTTPERSNTREILPPKAIAPHPSDTFVAADGVVVRSADVAGAATLRERAQHPSTSTAAGDSPDFAGELAQQDLRDEAAEIEEWVSRRQSTLMWRLASTLWLRERQASERADAAHKRVIAEASPDPGAVRRSRKRLLACWAASGLVLVGASIWAASKLLSPAALTWRDLGVGLGILIICSMLALYGGWQYYQALSHFERQVQRLLAERLDASEVFVVASREARRLAMLYEGVRDWAEVIGWLLHEPWVLEGSVDSKVDVDVTDLPASVAIAVPAVSTGDVPARLEQDAIAVLCNPGWSCHLFDDIVAGTQDRIVHGEADGGHLPADLDAGVSNNGARQRLMDAVASPDLRAGLGYRARARVASAIVDGEIDVPTCEVVRLGEYAAPESISDAELFAGALRPATPFVGDLWTDQGLQDGCHVVAHSLAWVPAWLPTSRVGGEEKIESRHSVGNTSVRVDMSRPCQPEQIALFAPRLRLRRPPEKVTSGPWV